MYKKDYKEIAKIINLVDLKGKAIDDYSKGVKKTAQIISTGLADYFEREDICKECLVKHFKGKTTLSCYDFKGSFNRKEFLKVCGVE